MQNFNSQKFLDKYFMKRDLVHPYDFMRYRQLSMDDSIITPQKIRRRLNILKKWPDSFKIFFPKNTPNEDYWNCKLPILSGIVDNENVTYEVKRECIQYLINAVENIINLKTTHFTNDSCKIISLISIPDLFSSEITIFFNQEYYEHFFKRSGKHQTWQSVDNTRSLLKEYNIKLPTNIVLQEVGFIENIIDEDYSYQGEVWAIGQLGTW